jgi:hypothetical protein
MKTYNAFICVSESEANKFINDNLETVLSDFGPYVFDALGMVIHKIFSHAATTVKYKDIFEVECPLHDAYHTAL